MTAKPMSIILLLATVFSLVSSRAWADEDPVLDPLLRLLIKKGVITRPEALEIQKEYDEMDETTKTAPKRSRPEPKTATAPAHAVEKQDAASRFHLGTLIFASYQAMENVHGRDMRENRFTVKRAYLDFKFDVTDNLLARVTPDVRQDQTGDWKARFKYIHGKFHWERFGFIGKPSVEFGLSHMPWLDWEETMNGFRMQDPMFLEVNHIFNSADLGVLFGGNFGDELSQEFRENVNHHYAGRWGSFQVGLYNGGGYHSVEETSNKAVEGRFSFRPMPGRAPGFQVTALGITGKGNTSAEPDWDLVDLMLSYEGPGYAITAQYERGSGNQSGSMVDDLERPLKHEGYSIFARMGLDDSRTWHLIGRVDYFDPDRLRDTDDEQLRWIAGVAWRFSGNNYWLLDYQNLEHDAEGMSDESRWQLTLQIKY